MASKKRVYIRKEPRQERSSSMVEAILETAARVFVSSGYARATTNRIAEAANVSVGSVYQYFASKDAIAIELLRRYRETVPPSSKSTSRTRATGTSSSSCARSSRTCCATIVSIPRCSGC